MNLIFLFGIASTKPTIKIDLKMKLKQFIKYNADVEERKCSVEHDRTFLILT